MTSVWGKPVKLHEVARGPLRLALSPDAGERSAIARELGLRSLPSLSAEVLVKPWLDGAELSGRFEAVVEQICGVTLEPFEQPVAGEIFVRVVPRGSPNAPADEAAGEMELDLEADDPPDVLAGEEIDVAGYVVEHLALELDPFPRKPGASFEYKAEEADLSPFAALKALKGGAD